MCVLTFIADRLWDLHVPTWWWVVGYIVDMDYSRKQGRKEANYG